MSVATGTGRFFRASRERLELLRERRREEGLETAEAPSIPRRKDSSAFPLSFSQERLWFLDRLDPANPAWNIPISLRLRGRLEAAALARALSEVVRRHEVLRATFHDHGGRPLQSMAPASPVPLPVIDLRALPPGRREEEARRATARAASRPFRLGEGPLVRARLLQLGDEDHALSLEVHHIVADGWSLGVLVREITALYARETLPDLAIQYADYAVWQREHLAGEALEAQIAWWRERLAGSPPSLDLPTDRPRPATQTFHGARAACLLPAALTDRLRSLAGGAGASLFMVLLAAFQLLLARWSGQEDVPVGSPIAGRTRREVEGLIGLFLNNLVLRTDLSGDPTFRALLGRVREVAVGAYAHQDLPFEKLLAELELHRDLSRTPLFQVFFNLQSFPVPDLRLPGLTVEGLDAPPEPQSKFDLTFYLMERDGGLRIDLVYNAALFDAARMEEALAQYRFLLEQAVADPEARIGSFSLLTGAARQVLPDPTEELDASWPGSASDAVASHARETPDRPAVLWDGGGLTYRQLDQEVDRVASGLRADGIGRGDVVAIRGHRSAPLVPAIVGVMRAGAAFVILDPAYPEARNAEILEVAGPAGVLTPCPPLPSPPHRPGEGAPPPEDEGRQIGLSGWWRPLSRGKGGRWERGSGGEVSGGGADDLACIAFTSGSTGTPKGILGLHRSLTHFHPWMSRAFQLGPDDRFSVLSGLSHDPLQRDVFTPLWLGAAIAIPDPERMAEPGWLAGWMARTGVTVANLTPAMSRLLTEPPAGPMPALRRVFFIGDLLVRHDVERLRALAPDVSCINLYGSTETQRALSYHRIEEDEAREIYPLGRGMPDVQLLVLNRSGQLAGIGEVGEVSMRSPHLAAGYLGDPELTAERFVTNPFTGVEGDRVYRTGDLGRYRPDGEVDPLGRADLQVQIRGFRVELGEVEAALVRHPAIREAVVAARGESTDRRLMAWTVPAAEPPDLRELRDFLRSRLPEYMIPVAFVFLETLPLTPNRKVDRRALPEPGRPEPPEAAAPRTPAEELLAAVWSEVLETDRIGPEDDFFALGGHSLRVTQVLARVREAFGVELPVRSVFESPTLAGLAGRIEEALRAGAAAAALPLVQASREGDLLPLSFAQERLWFLDRLFPGSTANNMPAALRLSGALDPAVLEGALRETVRRHEALRTTFQEVDGEPRQRIHPFRPFLLPLADLRGLPPGAREAEAEQLVRAEAAHPFDLAHGPLLRAVLLRLDESDWMALLCLHHIVSDGWSVGILVQEIVKLSGGAVLPELPVQYADFALWQRGWLQGEALAAQVAYWREALQGVPAILDLPTDRPRPAVQTFHGARAACRLPAVLADRLRSLARGAGASLFMVLLAAFQLLLARWSGQEDVPVGSPIAGRTRREVEGLIGLFLNHLVLRTDLSDDPTFRELLGRVREVAVGAYAHQDLPFEKLLVELELHRDLSRTPLFQVFFNLLSFPVPDLSLPGLTVRGLDAPPEPQSKFDMTFYLMERDGDVRITLVYNATLFDASRMEEALAQYRLLLEQAAADPEARIGSFSLLTAAARQVLPDPVEALDASWPGSVPDAVARHARETPDRFALLWEDGGLTYHQLDQEVDQVASGLRAAGIGRGDVVAIQGHRSAPLVSAILGVLRAGAAFVILDPAYPEARNAKILEVAEPAGVLTPCPPLPSPPLPPGEGAPPPGKADLPALLVLGRGCPLSRGKGGRWERGSGGEVPGGSADDLACLAFTSGSTGTPKGVLGLHRSLTHFHPWMSQAFQLGPDDRFSLLSGLSHDPLQRDIFTPLWLGAAVVIPDPERMAEPGWLAGWMAHTGVTVANLTPAMSRLLTEPPAGPMPALRRAFFIGDLLTRRDVERLRALAPDVACVNLYGSTETQRALSYHRVGEDEAREVYPLGRGMPDAQLLVLDRSGRLAGIGEVGEVCMRSPHLATGYLGDPELTARRFVTNPFTGMEGDRLYRTGDLGRYRPDGEVDPLGRADLQVQIRGFRVELGEVEAALARHPAIREAVVAARGESTDRRLVAWAVPAAPAPDLRELRDFLRARLPDYMIPAAFVFLEALPLTPNHKVDRRALPELEREETGKAAAPRTPLEDLLAAIWSEVLGADRIGPEDDFFALGGHSLRVTQVLARVREACGVELPVRSVFEASTLAGLAVRIEEALRAGGSAVAPPLVRAPHGGDLPLSFAQERLWFLDRLFPGSAAYNMPAALRLSGVLDPAVLERTLREIVRRHEVLRTIFPEVEGVPRQRIHPIRPFPLPLADLRGLPPSAREAEAERIVRAEAARPFDLARGPLLRAALLRLEERDWMALLCTHHIVSDGWSVGVLVREIANLARGAELPELPVQYADFALWQRGWLQGEVLEAQIAFWRHALQGAPAVLDLPLDHPRSPGAGRAGVRTAVLPLDLSVALRELGRHQGATLFMVLLAVFQALFHRLTGEDDLVVGSPIANRTHPGLEGLIGFFVNTLALRSRLEERDPSFGELLGRTRAVALAAYAHQDLPFERLVEELRVERSLHHAPVFQVLLVLQNAPAAALELPGLTLARVPLPPDAAKLDLSLSFVEGESGLHAALDYHAGLFDATTAARLLERLEALLQGIAAHPDCRLSEVPVMSEAERQQVVEEWSFGSFTSLRSFTSFDTLHGLFLAQAAQTPQAVALVFEGRRITYGELAERSARLAARLRELGVGPETRVAVSLPRSPELVETLLAIFQAGGAYVPLDPDDPPERRAWIAADCGAALVITSPAFLPSPARGRGAGGELPESLAYVIYTSGTTGRPKGAMVPHRAAVNHILWAQDAYGLGPGDAGLLKTPIGFDVSVREIFWPLSVGARVVIARPGGERDPAYLVELIEREEVTIASFVPSLLAAVLDRETVPPLKRLIAGGEALPAELAELCLQRLPGTLHNHYGPTETAVNATAWRYRPGERPVPIGRPIDNVRIDLLDAWGSPVPIGAAGEVHVGGAGVGRGYLGRPDLTAERFVPDPRDRGARQYRTGDLARWRPDGALEFLGRRDHQVKVRGFRIEPEEVEAALASCPGVREAAVVARDGTLVAYVVAAARDDGDLRAALAARLPTSLIPSAFVPVDALPRTASGKVDRRALARREIGRPVQTEGVPPRDDLERELARIWEDLLGVRPVGARDDFFTLGGHSLLAVRLASRVEARFGRPLPIATLFERPTVEALADWLRPSTETLASSPLVQIQPGGNRPPLFLVHPGGGGVLCYAELARALGPDQPLHGLQAPGLDGERPPLDRIGAMADLYLAAIRAAHPTGPWHLGGWSFGGLVAYEMACRLAEQGEPAGLVALLDALPRGAGRPEDEADLLVRGLDEAFLQAVPFSVDEIRGLDTRGQVAVVAEKARRAGRLPDDFDERRAASLVEVFKANVRAARAWEPRPYPGRITILRAADSDLLGPDPAGSWSAFAAADVVTVPGDHRHMVMPPHVETLAQALRSALDGWSR